jgi:transcriptional regulator with XRE-family HTH domain
LYGHAIRAVRESAGLKQIEIDGLTDRQLRRIELGEQMASPKALESLAKAHGLEISDYMNRLAAMTRA